MKQHIDTSPIWESYRQNCECPLCLLEDRAEKGNVDYFLGESVMEPDQRIEVNERGFCADHFKKMYDAGNRLGLALMVHTYMKQTIVSLKSNASRACEVAGADAGRSVFRRLGGAKGAGLREVCDELVHIQSTCLICDRVAQNMDRYIYTVLYMYKHEPDFPELFAKSRGMCLKHYAQVLSMANEHLSGEPLKRFVEVLTQIETENFERLDGELQYFTDKFDYRNQDKPWGSSKDAVKRSINKLRHQVIAE